MRKTPIVLILLTFLSSGWCQSVSGAAPTTVILEAERNEGAPGSELVVNVFLNTTVPLNAVDLLLQYPETNLQFMYLDSAGSIVDAWKKNNYPQRPGLIEVLGGMRESFRGTGGLVTRIHFLARDQGEATLTVLKNKFYAADGLGTEISAEVFSQTLLVSDDFPLIHPATIADPTPPELQILGVENLERGENILIFEASDNQSGLDSVSIRTKTLWRWTDWQKTENPTVLLGRPWLVELKVFNNLGNESFQSFVIYRHIYENIAVFLGTIFLVMAGLLFYNIKKSRPQEL